MWQLETWLVVMALHAEAVFPSHKYAYVNLIQGVLRGQEKLSTGNTKYLSFQGIPYAKPPLGDLRFKPPERPEPWSGVRDALKEGPDCLQTIPFVSFLRSIVLGSEDCLYLNVYTPQLPADGVPLRPVMVWIHGGGFYFGSGSALYFGPDYLIQEDVVLVTINYRLGSLGFLSLQDDVISGNAGLKDQVQALIWVQENIVQFGGDPTKVTVFGESAGGASVQYHMMSPMSRGLFSQAIIQSGSAFNPWAFTERPLERALRFARALGCDSTEPAAIKQFLANVPASDLIRAQDSILTDLERKQGILTPFVPCVEVEGDGVKFLTYHPRELMEQGLYYQVPLIVGSLPGEGVLFLCALKLNNKLFEELNSETDWIVPDNMISQNEDLVGLGNEIKDFYFKDKLISWETIRNYVDLSTDELFVLGVHQSLELQLHYSHTPIYNYEMTYIPGRSLVKFLILFLYKSSLGLQVPAHSDECFLLFSQSLLTLLPLSANDTSVSKQMTKMWTNFAKTGDPNDKTLSIYWEPTSLYYRNHLQIGSELQIINRGVQEDRMTFWQELYNRNPPRY